MRVHGYRAGRLGRRAGWGGDEHDLGSLDGVVVGEAEAEPVDLVEVEWVRVEDADVELPFLEVVGGDEGDAWGKGLLDLGKGRQVLVNFLKSSPLEAADGRVTLTSSYTVMLELCDLSAFVSVYVPSASVSGQT